MEEGEEVWGKAGSPVWARLMKDEWGRQWWKGECGCRRCLAEPMCVCVCVCVYRSWLTAVGQQRWCCVYCMTQEQLVNNVQAQAHLEARPVQLRVRVCCHLWNSQSIISTHRESTRLAHLFRSFLSIMLSVTLWTRHSLTPADSCAESLNHRVHPIFPNIPPCQSAAPGWCFSFPPESITLHLPLIVVPHTLTVREGNWLTNRLEENTLQRSGGQPDREVILTLIELPPLSVWPPGFFFSSLGMNHTLHGAKTRPECCPLRCCWQQMWTFLWQKGIILPIPV